MEVIDLNNDEKKVVEPLASEEVVKPKKDNIFKQMKDKISSLTKKQKIIFGIIFGIILIIIIVVSVFLLTKEEEVIIEEEEPVILSMGNYKYIDGILYFYSSDDVELGSYECSLKDETLCYLSISELDESLDNTIKVYSDYSLVTSYVDIYENLVFVNDNESVFLYDLDENEILIEYTSVASAYDNYVILGDENDKYAIANISGEVNLVTEFTYDYIGYIEGTENFVFSKNSDYGIVDNSGKELINEISGSVINYNEKYIVTLSGSSYSLINYDNDELLSGFDYIKIYDGYIYGIKDNLLYLYDSDFNKLNEVGSEISEITEFKDYGIYSDELQLTSTEYIIDFEKLSDKTLKVEGVSYNVYESSINGSLDYSNYLAGTWYFYSDEEKTSLIGAYDCTVENSVSSSDDTYSSCYVAQNTDLYDASETVEGILPIVHSRYVFMYDTQTLTINDNIVLYDLENDKSLANYTAVDFIDFSDFEETSYLNEDVTILAKNADKEYGMITLESSGASGLIEFSYTSFSVLNEYYVFTTSDGYNYLYEQNGTCLNENSKIKNTISDYYNGYLIVTVNGNKQIYGTDGTIVSDAYVSLILKEELYLGIDSSNNIYIYYYEDNTINYFIDEIDTSYEYLSFKEIETNYYEIVLYTIDNEILGTYYVSVGTL